MAGVLCPGLSRQPEWQLLRWAGGLAERVLLVGYAGLALHARFRRTVLHGIIMAS
jgi:hypothetical protein